MTSDNTQKSVLIVGKSQLVLDGAVASLRQLGYTAQATNDFANVTDRFDLRHVDLVVFGGQVPADRKAELTDEISTINPQVIFVQGLAGIPGLITQQVQEAFAVDFQDPDRRPTYDPDHRAIHLTLAQPARVKVTAWWQTSFIPPDPRSDSLVLHDGPLGAGDHTIPLPDQIPDHAAFAAVEVDKATYTLTVATQ